MRVADLLASGAARLARAGVASAHWDAELLLRHALGWDRAKLLAAGRDAVAPPGRIRFEALVERRAAREPLQHLVGRQAFWRHEFRVTPDVLIPRPETEFVVEAALAEIAGRRRPVIVDVGTGSGCIAISLASERPDAVLHAVDVSPAALGVARDNALRIGVAERIRFHTGDLLEPVASLGPVDLVVSNPPYVDPASPLEPEVRDHEPPLALFPPGGSLSVYERLAPQARSLLTSGGALVVEIGAGMADAVERVLAAAGLSPAGRHRDLAGIERVLVARQRARDLSDGTTTSAGP